jgi:GTP cyclohydrolase I
MNPLSDPLNLSLATEYLAEAMRLIWGDRLDTEGMADTPRRVAKHWIAITQGLHQDPSEPLKKTFPCDHREPVVIRDIPFNSLCEHHLLPFWGVAHVMYVPQGQVVGLSKIPRAIDIICARPQMQERITSDLANLIQDTLNPVGCAVMLEGYHSCMTTRGVLKAGSKTITTAVRGYYAEALERREPAIRMLTTG